MSGEVSSIPSELAAWPGHTGNWGRWPNDRGTLNLLTPEVTRRGLAASTSGQVISCGRPLSLDDVGRSTPGASVEMMTAGDLKIEVQSAKDQMSFRTHGLLNTHIDAISHYGYHNYGFNGAKFSDYVTVENGSRRWDIAGAGPIVTRGIFVDVARKRGVEYFEPGEAVMPEEIADAVELLLPGDAIVIRTGATLKRGTAPDREDDPHYTRDPHEGMFCAGLHPDCVELFGRKDVSVIATDTPNERLPVPRPTLCRSPVHVLALTIYGIHLIHNMNLEQVGEVCATQSRNSFLFMVSPLNVPGATGSLVAPVAVL